MQPRMVNVLFLCTDNSARSIMAEALLNTMAPNRFRAYSGGRDPAAQVSPYALELLTRNRMRTEGLRSKNWDEFAGSDAPRLDFVFTFCDDLTEETLPAWSGEPMSAHWGVEDPAAVEGTEEVKRKAFFRTYSQLQHRLSIFVDLPMDKLDRLSLQRRLDGIGEEAGAQRSPA